MSHKKPAMTSHPAAVSKNRQNTTAHSAQPTVSGPADLALQRVLRYVSAGEFEKALDVLATAGKSARLQNARGVCLMRLGRTEPAIRVFREFLLNPGSTWMRPDLPTVYKANYATALLVGGHPSGALEILGEIKDAAHPSVQRLRAAIRDWEASLSFWQRLNWRFGKIEPSGRPVQLDFPPGEFDEPSS